MGALLEDPLVNLATATSGLNLILSVGQSNECGAEAWPALPAPSAPGLFMIGDDVRQAGYAATAYQSLGPPALNPASSVVRFKDRLVEPPEVAQLKPGTTCVGETIALNAARCLRAIEARRSGNGDAGIARILIQSTGVGDTALDALASVYYERIVGPVAQACEIAKSLGVSVEVSCVPFIQGESDYLGSGASKNRADYKTCLKQFHRRLVDDLMAMTGQDHPPAFIIVVPGKRYSRSLDIEGKPDLFVAMAMLEFAEETPGVFIAGPYLPVPDKGGHLDANGVRWVGVKVGQVAHQLLIERRPWVAATPARIEHVSPTELIVTVRTPKPPLRFGTAYNGAKASERLFVIDDLPGKGFAVIDALGRLDVQATIASPTTVKLQLGRPLEADARVVYAGQETKGLGLVCDSDDFVSPLDYVFEPGTGQYAEADIPGIVGRPYDMSNWLTPFYLPIGPLA